MNRFRHLIAHCRILLMLLLGAALAMKVLVPTGYMLGSSSKILTIQICNDGIGGQATKQIVIPMDGKSQNTGKQHSNKESPCVYSALAMASLSGADAPLLATALIFILALWFEKAFSTRLAPVSHLRPPLRGPPATV